MTGTATRRAPRARARRGPQLRRARRPRPASPWRGSDERGLAWRPAPTWRAAPPRHPRQAEPRLPPRPQRGWATAGSATGSGMGSSAGSGSRATGSAARAGGGRLAGVHPDVGVAFRHPRPRPDIGLVARRLLAHRVDRRDARAADAAAPWPSSASRASAWILFDIVLVAVGSFARALKRLLG